MSQLTNQEDVLINRSTVLWEIEHWHDLIPYVGNTRDYMEHLHEKVLSLPLQQGGNEKIKELIEKKMEENKNQVYRNPINLLQELLSEIENLPPNN